MAERIKASLTARTYRTPARRLSSQLFLERVKPNALAPYLTPVYEMFFRAEDPEKIDTRFLSIVAFAGRPPFDARANATSYRCKEGERG